MGYSLDGGATWINDNTPPGIRFSQKKPNEVCQEIKICEDTGVAIIAAGEDMDQIVNRLDYYPCSILCEPVAEVMYCLLVISNLAARFTASPIMV